MKTLRHIFVACALALTAMLAGGCGIYSFSGTSIQPPKNSAHSSAR